MDGNCTYLKCHMVTHAMAKPPRLESKEQSGGDPFCCVHSLSLIPSPKCGLMWWYLRQDSSRDRRACLPVTGSKTGPLHLHTAPGGLVLCPLADGRAGPGRLCHLSSWDAAPRIIFSDFAGEVTDSRLRI